MPQLDTRGVFRDEMRTSGEELDAEGRLDGRSTGIRNPEFP
jgi:hypothetical protein